MNSYYSNEEYPLEDCNATHVCNHPHLARNQKGWCIGKHGHKGVHRCGRCASIFESTHVKRLTLIPLIPEKQVYTREEILHFLNERIAKYERLARVYPSKRKQFGYKIDELITITNTLLC